MEINARIYAVATSEDLLRQAWEILQEKTGDGWFFAEKMTPCEALPLSRTWYGVTERAEPTDGAKAWLDCVEECAQLMRQNGAVVVEFRSPDHPDGYLEYAYTRAGGQAGSGGRAAICFCSSIMRNS